MVFANGSVMKLASSLTHQAVCEHFKCTIVLAERMQYFTAEAQQSSRLLMPYLLRGDCLKVTDSLLPPRKSSGAMACVKLYRASWVSTCGAIWVSERSVLRASAVRQPPWPTAKLKQRDSPCTFTHSLPINS